MPSDFREPGSAGGAPSAQKEYLPPITVSGGAGGINADLTDMQTVATRLGTVGAALTTMWTNASADLASVSIDTDAVLCASTATMAITDMAPLTAGPTSLFATGTALTGLKTAVSGCKLAYEAQDKLRKDGFVEMLRTGGLVPLARRFELNLYRCGGSLAVYYLRHGKLPPKKDVFDYVPVDSVLTHRVMGTLFALTPPQARQTILGAFVDPEMPLHVEKARREAPGRPPRGVEDLIGKAGMKTDEKSQTQDEVRLTRVSDGQGGHSWIVAMPGTEDFGEQKDKGTPRDSESNVLALLGGRPLVMDAIHAALARQMRAVGADPAKEPVMLVGHSQGGIVAAKLASDRKFLSTFRVKSVLTSGAPISRLIPPKDIQMLSLEHTTDSVPQLDGRKLPDTPNVTAVTRDTTMAPPKDFAEKLTKNGLPPGQGMLNPHRETVYQETARTVDARTGDASLDRWRQDSAEFLNGTSQESWTVDMTRVEGQSEKIKMEP